MLSEVGAALVQLCHQIFQDLGTEDHGEMQMMEVMVQMFLEFHLKKLLTYEQLVFSVKK